MAASRERYIEVLDRLTKDDFIPLLHDHFQIRLEGIDPVDLELVSVNSLGEAARAGGQQPLQQPGLRQPYSLHFLGPVSSMYLKQHIYALENDRLGTLELFIVPLGPEAGRMRYEAIIA